MLLQLGMVDVPVGFSVPLFLGWAEEGRSAIQLQRNGLYSRRQSSQWRERFFSSTVTVVHVKHQVVRMLDRG